MDITGRVGRFLRGQRSAGGDADSPGAATRGSALIDTELAAVGLHVVEELGRGGFGVVYRAHQPGFQRTVAVKVLSGIGPATPEHQRFEREIKALGGLGDHPHIVTVHDAGWTPSGWPYIVMADMPGGSLSDQLRAGLRPDPATVAAWGVKLAGALAAAHAQDVLHRDIKPENVLLDRFGEPALGDFGIARVRGATETRSGVITGSLAHAAPEMLGPGGSSELSDVYSLGSTLYTLLAGSPPFVDGSDETPHALVARILNAPVPDLAEKGVPHNLAAVIASALSRDPKERIQSAVAFGRALQVVQTDSGWPLTALVTAQTTSTHRSAEPDDRTEAPGPEQPTRTHQLEELLPKMGSSDTPQPPVIDDGAEAGPLVAPPPPRVPRPRSPRLVVAGVGIAMGLVLAALLMSWVPDQTTPVSTVSPSVSASAPATTTPSPTATAAAPTVEAVATEAPPQVTPPPVPARRSVSAPKRTTRPKAVAPSRRASKPSQPKPPPSSAPNQSSPQPPPPPPPSPRPTSSPRPSGPGCQDCGEAPPPGPGCQDCETSFEAGGVNGREGWSDQSTGRSS